MISPLENIRMRALLSGYFFVFAFLLFKKLTAVREKKRLSFTIKSLFEPSENRQRCIPSAVIPGNVTRNTLN